MPCKDNVRHQMAIRSRFGNHLTKYGFATGLERDLVHGMQPEDGLLIDDKQIEPNPAVYGAGPGEQMRRVPLVLTSERFLEENTEVDIAEIAGHTPIGIATTQVVPADTLRKACFKALDHRFQNFINNLLATAPVELAGW